MTGTPISSAGAPLHMDALYNGMWITSLSETGGSESNARPRLLLLLLFAAAQLTAAQATAAAICVAA